MNFLNSLIKGLQTGFLVTKGFTSFWLRIYNFCFEVGTISRAYNARLGMVGTSFMFIKTRELWQKVVGFNVLLTI